MKQKWIMLSTWKYSYPIGLTLGLIIGSINKDPISFIIFVWIMVIAERMFLQEQKK